MIAMQSVGESKWGRKAFFQDLAHNYINEHLVSASQQNIEHMSVS